VDTRALAVLAAHPWPGNLRELAHVLEAALILAGERGFASSVARVLAARSAEGAAADARAAPSPSARYSFYGSELEERERIRLALERCRGNRTRAARELGMSRNTLRDRVRRLGL
jgi:DNA-binding NtrC family response regulator